MCNFHKCGTWTKLQKHGLEAKPTNSFAMFFWPCKNILKTSRDGALIDKARSHVFLSTVLADGRCLKAHVPPRTGNRLLKDYLW